MDNSKSEQKNKHFVIQWRDAVLSTDGPTQANTRLVLMALTKYMTTSGGNCYPSSRGLSDDTALSRKTVETHLRKAEAEGWILILNHRLPGKKWRRHAYKPLLKGGVAATPASDEGGVAATPASDEGGVNDARRWSNSQPEGGVTATPEQTIEQTIEQKKDIRVRGGDPQPKTKLTQTDLVNEFGIPPDLAAEYLQIRKDKRATLTPRAWKMLCNEFEKAGLSVIDGLELCCSRSWAGCRASWIKKDGDNHGSSTKQENNFSRTMRRNIELAQSGQ